MAQPLDQQIATLTTRIEELTSKQKSLFDLRRASYRALGNGTITEQLESSLTEVSAEINGIRERIKSLEDLNARVKKRENIYTGIGNFYQQLDRLPEDGRAFPIPGREGWREVFSVDEIMAAIPRASIDPLLSEMEGGQFAEPWGLSIIRGQAKLIIGETNDEPLAESAGTHPKYFTHAQAKRWALKIFYTTRDGGSRIIEGVDFSDLYEVRAFGKTGDVKITNHQTGWIQTKVEGQDISLVRRLPTVAEFLSRKKEDQYAMLKDGPFWLWWVEKDFGESIARYIPPQLEGDLPSWGFALPMKVISYPNTAVVDMHECPRYTAKDDSFNRIYAYRVLEVPLPTLRSRHGVF